MPFDTRIPLFQPRRGHSQSASNHARTHILPGLQFYILQLDGKLTYEFALPNRPAKTFSQCSSDFEGLDLQRTDASGRLPAGTIASAVGLNIELVRNDGIFTLDYEGENESTAIWTFESLQEVGQRPAMYASAATQTCITTFVVKGMQTVRKPLIDEKSESFLLSKGSKITSFLCEASNGDVWNVSTSGVEKRVRGE